MWSVLGWICVGLGAVGAVLPILPTVPFLLLAAFCFERGSPRLHSWLMNHPQFGPPLKAWRQHGVIGVRAKVLSVVGISCSVSYVLFFRDFPFWIKAVMTGSCLAIILFILTRPSRRTML